MTNYDKYFKQRLHIPKYFWSVLITMLIAIIMIILAFTK